MATHRFNCGNNMYKLRFIKIYTDISCHLESDNGIFDVVAPARVSAIVGGEMKEFERKLASFSASIYDPKVAYARTTVPFELSSVQIVIEFQDPSLTPNKITDGEKQVLKSFEKLFETGILADILFIVQGQNIKGHTVVAAAGSPVFAAMLQEDDFKGQMKTIIIEDMEANVFQEMLRYLYTGVVQFNEMGESLFLAAEKYEIDSLKNECETHLHSNFTVENVTRRLILAHLHSAHNLLKEAIHFIAANREDVWSRSEWKELSKDYPELFFVVTEKMKLTKTVDDIKRSPQ